MFYSSPRSPTVTNSRAGIRDNFTVGADIDLDLDLDLNIDLEEVDASNLSISSSPQSSQSVVLSQHPVLSSFDSVPSLAVAPRAQTAAGLLLSEKLAAATAPPQIAPDDLSMLHSVDLMHPDSWLTGNGQFTPRSAGRISHHRESSLSSLGSTGPASPFSHNTSNPQIAVTDSVGDGYHGMAAYYEDSAASYQVAKPMASTSHDTYYLGHSGYVPDTAAPAAYPSLLAGGRPKSERDLLPPPELSIGSNRSRPVSVASSIGGDSPATPSLEQPEDDRRRRHAFVNSAVPKLDRTMTDIYGDELYSPNFSITSAAPSQSIHPSHDMFAQRLQAISTQHLNAVHSPVSVSSRDRSPFRHGSPLAPTTSHDFNTSADGAAPSQMRFASAQQLREQRKAAHDAQAMQQQMSRNANTATPQTISPKDAVLDFQEADSANDFPLFPQAPNAGPFTPSSAIAKPMTGSSQAFSSVELDGTGFSFLAQQEQGGLQVPQQYPFIAQPRPSSTVASLSGPLRMSSADASPADSRRGGASTRSSALGADGGTYTCTYHGCTLRFDTPALLQKHKREGHRQAHGLNGTRRSGEAGNLASVGSVADSQAGPHRCDRINPSTGKPCNTIFSRPYDLTRHEDTIHNARKQKVRCGLCTEEKTFSRADALTRHFRVCHPDVEFAGKHRRRGGHSI